MFLAVRAYQELLLNIVAMVSSKDEKIRTSGMVLRSDVFYEAEYREVCIQQLSLYQPEKMSLSFLKDLVETTHVFLKLMEHMSKASHIMISSKKTKKKTKSAKTGGAGGGVKKSGTSASGDGFVSQGESNERIWDTISLELSRILQDAGVELPDIVAPFDAVSEVPIEDQRLEGFLVPQNWQKSLKRNQFKQTNKLLCKD